MSRAAATWCCCPMARTRAARPRRRAPGSNWRSSGVVLDAVSAGKGSQQKELAAFAKAGNGSLVTATDAAALTAAFESAARSLDTQLAVDGAGPRGGPGRDLRTHGRCPGRGPGDHGYNSRHHHAGSRGLTHRASYRPDRAGT